MVEIPALKTNVFDAVLIPVIVNTLPYSDVPSGKMVVVTPTCSSEHENGRLFKNI
jgi:hypothetical protein